MTHDASAVRRRTGLVVAVILVLLGAAAWFPYSSAGAATLAVTTASLPAAHQAKAYSATLTGAGGTAPYHWSVSGSLPAGLSLSSAGVIRGTPTTAGTATVTVKLSDSAAPTAASATKTLTLAVLAPPNQSMVYVLNDRPDVTEYAPGASGNAAPIAQIGGPSTQLGSDVFALAVSPAGEVYVLGLTMGMTRQILEFAPGSNGDVAPQGDIMGSLTGLNGSTGIALDKAGDIWVANLGSSTITEYRPAATGNAMPLLTIEGTGQGEFNPYRLTFDAAGNLWVSSLFGPLTEYSAASLQQKNLRPVAVAPIATVTSSAVPGGRGIAVDPLGGVHVIDVQHVFGFAPGTPSGNATPAEVINPFAFDELSLSADPAGRLYVSSDFEVDEFDYSATGNAVPEATIAGPATELGGQEDIAVSPPAPLIFSGLTAFQLTHGATYRIPLGVTGGVAPYHFTVASGKLPPGMSVASDGSLTGTPTSTGSAGAIVKVTDSALPTARSTTETLKVSVAALSPLTIAPPSLPTAVMGSNYSAALTVNGGVPPYLWTLTAGALPAGIVLSQSGKITGSASETGTFTFTATVRDSASPASQTASITVSLLVSAQPGVYVANAGNDDVTEFALGAGGDVPPISGITGADTGLSSPESVVLDATGDIFVANEGNDTVTEYAPGAMGDARPVTTITGVSSPCRLALNAAGDLYVASLTGSIAEYRLGSGAPTLIATITGQQQPRGLAVDTSGHLWVSESTINSINEYSATASGNAIPIASLGGPDTGLAAPQGLVFDSAGNLTVANAGTNGTDGSITVYPASQLTGDSTPTQTLTSGLSEPLGIDRGTDQTIFAADVTSNAIVEYAPGSTTPSEVISGPAATQLDAPIGVAATPPVSILTRKLRAARQGQHYLVNLVAAEGTTPYRWKVAHDRLPRGLRLRKTGAIIGTPRSRPGVYRFTIRLTDSTRPTQKVTEQLRLRVKAPVRHRRHQRTDGR